MTKVLIVEDTETMRMLEQAMLNRLGLYTACASDGAEALMICAKGLPDAILLDWNMPNMDGPTFQQRLRAIPGGRHVKVIFCTVKSDLENMEVAMQGGACEYIMKPFDIEILLTKLQLAGLVPLPEAA